jgi:hypothetical protein
MDGYVNIQSFFEFRLNNCSGRRNKILVENGDMFLNEISKANIEQGTLNRKLIEENNDANLIASQLIAFYNEFVNKTPSI